MTTTVPAIDLERARLDPASVFSTPRDVLFAEGLSLDDKRSILARWQEDAEALMRATEEGMPAPELRAPGELLRAVQHTLQQLDESSPGSVAA
jgi:hypothetical protein